MKAIRMPTRCLLLLTVLLLTCPSAVNAQTERNTRDEKQKTKKLGQRLIRQIAGDDSEDIMNTIVRGMKQAARRLDLDFDPGEETQTLQQRIVDQLDQAIKTAAAQRRPIRRSQRSTSSDKRRKLTKKSVQRAGESTKAAGKKSNDTTAQQNPPEGGSPEDGPRGGRLDEVRRTWGHLPARERDEIIQGISESFLERYRDWIERYYRALQESDQ